MSSALYSSWGGGEAKGTHIAVDRDRLSVAEKGECVHESLAISSAEAYYGTRHK